VSCGEGAGPPIAKLLRGTSPACAALGATNSLYLHSLGTHGAVQGENSALRLSFFHFEEVVVSFKSV